MPPNDGSGQATQVARDRIDLLRQKLRATPAPVKVVGVAAVSVLVVMTPFLLGRLAYLIVVVPLLYGPVIVVLVAHFPPFARLANSWPQERAFAPCSTVALVLAWSVPPALVAWGLDRSNPVIAYTVAWGLAVLVLGWRVAKVWQRARGDTR